MRMGAMQCKWIALIGLKTILCYFATVEAQEISNTDIRAAYCYEIVRNAAAGWSTYAARAPGEIKRLQGIASTRQLTSQEQGALQTYAIAREKYSKYELDKNRLSDYLTARGFTTDTGRLLQVTGIIKEAHDDQSRCTQEISTCNEQCFPHYCLQNNNRSEPKCNVPNCFEQCAHSCVIVSRNCTNTDWLPF